MALESSGSWWAVQPPPGPAFGRDAATIRTVSAVDRSLAEIALASELPDTEKRPADRENEAIRMPRISCRASRARSSVWRARSLPRCLDDLGGVEPMPLSNR